jgi:uncharacterized membrane protein
MVQVWYRFLTEAKLWMMFQEKRTVEFFIMTVAGVWAGVVVLSFCMPTTRQ